MREMIVRKKRRDKPRRANLQLRLYGHEIRKYPQHRRTAHDHDQQPEIQLQDRPVVFRLRMADDDAFAHGRARGCHDGPTALLRRDGDEACGLFVPR